MLPTTMATPPLRYTLPIFVLLSLAGFYFIVLHMVLSHAPDRFLAVQEQSLVPLSVTAPYLPDIPFLDTLFTPLVSFFVAAFGESGKAAPSYPITLDFVWSFGGAIQLPLIEAARLASSPSTSTLSTLLLSNPMLWGVLYQRVSGGWILPLWLLVWLHSRVRTSPRPLERVRAEGVLFGWWVGHTLPALAMLVPGLPPLRTAPVWIAFPILMSGAQAVYLALVPKRAARRGRSGYMMTQLTYLSALALGAIAHAHVVLIPGLTETTLDAATLSSTSLANALLIKFRGLGAHLWRHYVPPSFAIPSPEHTTAASGVQHFVQFDVIIVFAAVWTAGLWDLALRRRASATTSTSAPRWATGRWVLSSAVLLLAIGVFFGPGVSTALLFAYREKTLECARRRSERGEDMLVCVSLVDGEKETGFGMEREREEEGRGLPVPVRRTGLVSPSPSPSREKCEFARALRSPNRWSSPTQDYFPA